MKTIMKVVTVLILLLSFQTQAQQRVALQSNGATTIFSSLNPLIDAYNAALDGDTIYLSGGAFVMPTAVAKGITFFGAGFHLDSTTATQASVITNNWSIAAGADGLYLEGIQMQTVTKSSIILVNNVSFVRCRIASVAFSNNGVGSSSSYAFIQNVIGTMELYGVINSLITNNIINGRFEQTNNNVISNNLFLNNPSVSYYTIRYANMNLFRNNIFNSAADYSINPGNGNDVQYNVFQSDSPDLGSVPLDFNNYKNIDISTVYVNVTTNSFDYTQDYHLLTAAQTTYLGEDGNQVGIYGGMFPFKEGAVPQNPHISSKLIAPLTDFNGDLNIQIQVGAQNN
jgi:hypothetical protein